MQEQALLVDSFRSAASIQNTADSQPIVVSRWLPSYSTHLFCLAEELEARNRGEEELRRQLGAAVQAAEDEAHRCVTNQQPECWKLLAPRVYQCWCHCWYSLP
jgi:hypothetical protein